MNDRPQATRENEQGDLLEQIITQGLDKMKAPAQAEPPESEAPPAPNPTDGGKTSPPSDRKNRRTAVYLYLLVLFGAALLMLLLAYFIQRRSSENLRDSMNLSREELLDEIRTLREQNSALGEELIRLCDDLSQWQTRYAEKDGELTDLQNQNSAAQEGLYSWSTFWTLERHYQSGDYESCAAVLLLQLMSQFAYSTPDGTQERYAEIIQTVIDKGILAEDYPARTSEYEELMDAYLAEHQVYFSPFGCYFILSD